MTYEHPLAYLLGIEGLALLRGFTGEFDREFVEVRLAEVRRLLDDGSLTEAVASERLDSVPGYEIRQRNCRSTTTPWASSSAGSP